MTLEEGEGMLFLKGRFVKFTVWQASVRISGQIDIVGGVRIEDMFEMPTYVSDLYRQDREEAAARAAAVVPED